MRIRWLKAFVGIRLKEFHYFHIGTYEQDPWRAERI
jgi:hypothetical protein